MKTPAVWYIGPGQVEIREVALPDPGPGEVQVHCLANGICMYEVTCYTGVEQRGPGVMGHEGVGRVEKVGPGVTGVAEGDYVACGPWQQRVNLPAAGLARFQRPLPDPVTMIVEPPSCAVTAVHEYAVAPGDRVLVLGAGYMGLLNVQLLAHCPLAELVVTDVKTHNLEVARQCGASEIILTSTPAGEARLAALRETPFDLVVEAAGVATTLAQAADFCRFGGKLGLFAWHHGERTVNFGTWHVKGLRVLNVSPPAGTDWHTNVFQRAIACLEAGVLDQGPLITHRHPFTAVAEALATAVDRPEGYLKGVLTFED